mmetsp:Transcript_48980/g.116514  ORF Transcript_48980/g.116514 Transcript_48980/m.116514 type:complete len:225 (+) Transcript_48980:2594-3268(+)
MVRLLLEQEHARAEAQSAHSFGFGINHGMEVDGNPRNRPHCEDRAHPDTYGRGRTCANGKAVLVLDRGVPEICLRLARRIDRHSTFNLKVHISRDLERAREHAFDVELRDDLEHDRQAEVGPADHLALGKSGNALLGVEGARALGGDQGIDGGTDEALDANLRVTIEAHADGDVRCKLSRTLKGQVQGTFTRAYGRLRLPFFQSLPRPHDLACHLVRLHVLVSW